MWLIKFKSKKEKHHRIKAMLEQATEKTLKTWHEPQRVGQKERKREENGRCGSQIKGKSAHIIGVLKGREPKKWNRKRGFKGVIKKILEK